MIEAFAPGFYQGLPFHEYLEDPAINNSGLKLFHQSPTKFKFWEDNDKPGTPIQIEGSALHCTVLEPDAFESRFGKDPAPRVGSVDRTKWDQKNPMAIPLTPRQWDAVEGMSKAFGRTPFTVAKNLLTDGISELSIFWIDPGTQLRCKIRPDYLKENSLIVDLKSTVNGSPKGFLREIWKWQYQIQATFYLRGLTAAYQAAGVNRQAEAFIFIAIESSPPYEVACYTLSENIIEEANIQIDETLEKYKHCLESGIYPSYPDQIITLGENND